MPRSLADGRIRLDALTTAPAALAAYTGGSLEITVDELAAGTRLARRIMKTDYRLSATASDTVNEPELAAEGNAVVYGASNYEGSVTPFRYFQSNGAADPINDVAWDLLREKGTELYLPERVGPKEAVTWAAGDVGELYHVITDNPQVPTSAGGFIKRVVPLGVQNRYPFIVTGTSAVPLITSITPSGAGEDDIVTIVGSRFTGVTAVTFGGVAATAFQVLSDHLMVATLPAGSAGSAAVIVTNAAGASASTAYTRGA
jgi:hypothetical protein